MGLKRFCIILIVTVQVVVLPVFSQTRLSTIHHLPSGDFLWHKQYLIRLNISTFVSAIDSDDEDESRKYKYAASGLIGITERFLFGIHATPNPGISFRGKVLSESGEYIPTVSLEASEVLASNEAAFYNVLNEDTLKGLQNAISVIVSKSIKPISMRVHLGVQTLPTFDTERFSYFGSIEQYIGGGSYLSVEAFRRFETHHINFGYSLRIGKVFIASVGLSEVNAYFEEENTTSASMTGYNTPGFWLSVAFSGNFAGGGADGAGIGSIEDELRGHNTRFNKMEKRIKALEDSVRDQNEFRQNMEKKMKDANMNPQNIASQRVVHSTIVNKLMQMMSLLSSDSPYDPVKVKGLKDDILKFNAKALPVLQYVMIDKTADYRMRTYAVNLVGQLEIARGSAQIKEQLVELLSEPNMDLRVESIVTIGKLKFTEALPELELLQNDPDEAVAYTAKEVVKQLQGRSSDSEEEAEKTAE